MKIEVNAKEAPRKLVGYVTKSGTLYLPLAPSTHCPDQRHVVLGSPYGTKNHIHLNGTGEIAQLFKPKHDTPIYEGDSVTITF